MTPAPHTDAPRSSRALMRDRNLQMVFGVTLMVVMGVASITPAFPRIAQALQLDPARLGLLVAAFTVPGVALTLPLGVLADRIGRKRVLVPSLVLFGVAGGACGLVSDFEVLLGLRLLQGVGAAALGVLNMTIISDLFTGRERAEALGLNASILTLGVASYPPLGGALASLDWHYPFFLPVLALPLALFVLLRLDGQAPNNTQSLSDYARAVWAGMRSRRMAGCFLAVFGAFVILYGPYVTFMPILLGTAFDAPPFAIGALMCASALAASATASQTGRLTARFGEPRLVSACFLFFAVAVIGMPLMPSLAWFVLPCVCIGVAEGTGLPSIQKLLADLAPPAQRGAFMSMNGWFLRLAQTVSPMVMAGVFAIWGMDGVFYSSAGFCLVIFGSCMYLLR